MSDELRRFIADELEVALTEVLNRTAEWCPMCGETVEGLDLHLMAQACKPRTVPLLGILNSEQIAEYTDDEYPREDET